MNIRDAAPWNAHHFKADRRRLCTNKISEFHVVRQFCFGDRLEVQFLFKSVHLLPVLNGSINLYRFSAIEIPHAANKQVVLSLSALIHIDCNSMAIGTLFQSVSSFTFL